MATVHRLPVRTDPELDESILARLQRLVKLEIELALAEARDVLISAAIAIVVAIPAVVLILASLVVLVAAAFAPLFDARWEPLLIAGGGIALLAGAALAWSLWRLTHLTWPKETVTSFQETWRWLAAQLKSVLRLR